MDSKLANTMREGTHRCVFRPGGADKAFCIDTSTRPVRNQEGCTSSNCASVWRRCRACVVQSGSPDAAIDPLTGLCAWHTENGEAARRSGASYEDWIRPPAVVSADVDTSPPESEEEEDAPDGDSSDTSPLHEAPKLKITLSSKRYSWDEKFEALKQARLKLLKSGTLVKRSKLVDEAAILLPGIKPASIHAFMTTGLTSEEHSVLYLPLSKAEMER